MNYILNTHFMLPIRDSLTGLLNHRAFEFARNIAELNATTRFPLAHVRLSLDGLRQLSLTRGYGCSDQLLRSAAGVFKEIFAGKGCIVARYGGEDFSVLLPGCGLEKALLLSETASVHLEALAATLGIDIRVWFDVSITPPLEGHPHRFGGFRRGWPYLFRRPSRRKIK